MATISGSDFKSLINDSEITTANAERVLDQSIDLVNLYGKDVEISNLSGSEGSKSLGVSQKERGAIYYVARAVYASFYKNAPNNSSAVGNISVNLTDLMSNSTVLNAVKEVAGLLRDSDLEVDVG